METSMLALAQRSCIDLLDKVAIATSEYLGLPGSPKKISFSNRWFLTRKKDEQLNWEPSIRQEIIDGNTALIALAEVSRDIESGGFLTIKKSIRHGSTHRFTVLHDIESAPKRESKFIEHLDSTAFTGQLIETLQLARAVIFYFVELIRCRERRLAGDGSKCVALIVPDHDWIRGRE
jgi:hypothetical protein